jgi:hypothetical protein
MKVKVVSSALDRAAPTGLTYYTERARQTFECFKYSVDGNNTAHIYDLASGNPGDPKGSFIEIATVANVLSVTPVEDEEVPQRRTEAERQQEAYDEMYRILTCQALTLDKRVEQIGRGDLNAFPVFQESNNLLRIQRDIRVAFIKYGLGIPGIEGRDVPQDFPW